jgi:hypothetical protein
MIAASSTLGTSSIRCGIGRKIVYAPLAVLRIADGRYSLMKKLKR